MTQQPRTNVNMLLSHIFCIIYFTACLITARCSTLTWTADDVFPLLQILASVKTEKLQQHVCARLVMFLVLHINNYVSIDNYMVYSYISLNLYTNRTEEV